VSDAPDASCSFGTLGCAYCECICNCPCPLSVAALLTSVCLWSVAPVYGVCSLIMMAIEH
jgi:hypothetical protein